MNLNKLTKEQLVDHAKSIDIYLDIESKKYDLIDSLTNYQYTKCEGCGKKITDEYYAYDDRYECQIKVSQTGCHWNRKQS